MFHEMQQIFEDVEKHLDFLEKSHSLILRSDTIIFWKVLRTKELEYSNLSLSGEEMATINERIRTLKEKLSNIILDHYPKI